MQWKFQKISSITNTQFEKLLKNFHEYGVSGLVRENIQNSLDAKIRDLNEPVTVPISIGKIKREFIPGYKEISPG